MLNGIGVATLAAWLAVVLYGWWGTYRSMSPRGRVALVCLFLGLAWALWAAR